MTRVAIIVLNWNGADDAIECMRSLLSQTLPPTIFLVDNASADDSIRKFEDFIAEQPEGVIQLYQNAKNLGFAGGINTGIIAALDQKFDYIGTLNPDATADSEWVREITSELSTHTGAGIATGILARTDHEHIDSTGDFYTTWGIPGPRNRGDILSKAPQSAEYIFGATGGGFIAKSEVFTNIGMFDEKFFMYFEDVDLCFRAQLAGYKVRYTPDAVAYHKLSASSDKVPGLAVTQTFKNLPMLLWKNVPRGLISTISPRFSLAYFLILGHAIVQGCGGPALKGFFQSLLLIPHTFTQRRQIQRAKQVSTKYISSIILHDIPPEQTGLRKFRSLFTGVKK